MIKDRVIQVRFTGESVDLIGVKSRLLGLGVSTWIRMLVLRELDEDIWYEESGFLPKEAMDLLRKRVDGNGKFISLITDEDMLDNDDLNK